MKFPTIMMCVSMSMMLCASAQAGQKWGFCQEYLIDNSNKVFYSDVFSADFNSDLESAFTSYVNDPYAKAVCSSHFGTRKDTRKAWQNNVQHDRLTKTVKLTGWKPS
jgi:hypothetical protein